MNFLIFDTETTGFTKYCDDQGKDLKNANRMTQLAFKLITEKGDILHSFESLIKPNKWFVPKENFFIENNMSTDRCEKYGIEAKLILNNFQEALKKCDYKVAHNLSFDNRIVLKELTIAGISKELFQFKKGICTMTLTRDYVGAHYKNGRRGNKAPKLSELHNYLFGVDFEDAHDALGDVTATSHCLIECIDRGLIKI